MGKLIKGDNNIINKTIDFLNEQIKTDEQLRAAIEKDDKTISGLWEYIKTKALKQLSGKFDGIEKEVVFGWAIHYFIETEETINQELGINKQKVEKQKNETVKETPKPASKALSIFDFLGDEA